MAKHYDTIVLGGGASGLMAAALLTGRQKVLLIEGNTQVGAKMLISGGGRCNITNANLRSEDYVPNNGFARSALAAFDQHALLSWLSERGLEPVLQKEHQYFCPTSARQIVDLFVRAIRGVEQRTGCRIDGVERGTDALWRVQTSCGVVEADQVVVATGGMSFPKLGATDIGHRIAASLGHTIAPVRPALVGMTLQREQFFFKELSGLSTEVLIRLPDEQVRGKLLFAHKGISGPAVLDASLYWKKGTIVIDFLPGFDWRKLSGAKKQISTLLPIPRRMAKAFLDHFGIEDKPAYRLKKEEQNKLQRLGSYEMAPAGTFGYTKAEVTQGGIATSEIDPETMQSRHAKGVYFVGEVLDVTGRLGGYNFQWAFSSAYACTQEIKSHS